jgi:hypothetical protein
VYNRLTEAIKKRMIAELRRFWSYDPVYRDDLVKHIQGKYSFRSRPPTSIILKGSSANHNALSADNFQGTVVSYCHVAKVDDNPGLAIEWVRENGLAINENGGTCPSPRGIYYIEVRNETVNVDGVIADRNVFYVDPLLEQVDEEPLQVSAFLHQLANVPIHPDSLRVYELPGNLPWVDGVNYTVNATTGLITAVNPLPTGVSLSVDYRYAGTSTGPYLLLDNHTNVQAIPGVVLAFGRQIQDGDIMAVIVSDRREEVAHEYGGRWDISLDLDVMALDVNAQGEITDKTMGYLNGVLKNRLSQEGIEIMEVSMGGESEEIYDENADDYFYNASISMTVQTDWSIHVPLSARFLRIIPQTAVEANVMAGYTDEELVEHGEANHLQVLTSRRVVSSQDPFFSGRSRTFEAIK